MSGAVVVTGAAHGIGRGVAHALAVEGRRIVAVDQDEAGLRSLIDEVPAAAVVVADLVVADLEDLADRIVEAAGPHGVGAVVHAAGSGDAATWDEVEEAEFARLMRLHAAVPLFLTRELVERSPALTAVVAVGSWHGQRLFGRPAYPASKAALDAVVRESAWVLAPRGVRVNAVVPGWVDVRDVRDETPGSRAWREHVPLGRGGTPQDVAEVVRFLLDDERAAYVTGSMVAVDGGLGLLSWAPDLVVGRPARRARLRARLRRGSRA